MITQNKLYMIYHNTDFINNFIESQAYYKTQSYSAFRDDYSQELNICLFRYCQKMIDKNWVHNERSATWKINLNRVFKRLRKSSINVYKKIFTQKKFIVLNKAMDYIYNNSETKKNYINIHVHPEDDDPILNISKDLSLSDKTLYEVTDFFHTLPHLKSKIASFKFLQRYSDKEIGKMVNLSRKRVNEVGHEVTLKWLLHLKQN